ncbi:MAG TPA: dTDP-4-dehydrorhamnose reductase [Candidatus Desulfofervidus auxilii]|uniref:dTDP-4-dehydrorhamnose reductase n=1 Tax=Desulfofervidus auxilii TaxID=1621989 RepID=A0A7C1ZMP1_DESA2|nr:dTDP-4-dehydrorhamnose reductase [Candidatus Desulfofervidus auxilii]
MKLLLTGANGQLAQDIWLLAQKKGWEVMAFTRQALDISNFKQVKEAITTIKPDIVINCAAYNYVDKAEKEWEQALLVNGIGPRNLATICERQAISLVHFSTDYVFDGHKSTPYTIADLPSPLNKYGATKLQGEIEVSHLTNRYYLIRVSWVFGLRGKTEVNFIKKLLLWSKDRDQLHIVTDQISSPSYTEDVAKAVLDLIQTGRFGLYHITNSGYCSRYQWAEWVLKKIDWSGKLFPARSKDFPNSVLRPAFSALDTFPLKNILGHELPSWQEATERFLKQWFSL